MNDSFGRPSRMRKALRDAPWWPESPPKKPVTSPPSGRYRGGTPTFSKRPSGVEDRIHAGRLNSDVVKEHQRLPACLGELLRFDRVGNVSAAQGWRGSGRTGPSLRGSTGTILRGGSLQELNACTFQITKAFSENLYTPTPDTPGTTPGSFAASIRAHAGAARLACVRKPVSTRAAGTASSRA
jgi:hypothetical protein